MSSKRQKGRKDPAYIREQGKRSAFIRKERNITFSLSKHIKAEGESIKEWNDLGLLEKLFLRMKYIGQHSVHIVKQMKWIKEYTKVSFPPDSLFSEPKHVSNVVWAVMHLTDDSKEVVVGFIENDIFYIIFLDKEHNFWPSPKKNT